MDVESLLWFKGKTKAQMADALGVSAPHFSNICKGKHPLPIKLVAPMASLLGVSKDEIVTAFDTLRESYSEKSE